MTAARVRLIAAELAGLNSDLRELPPSASLEVLLAQHGVDPAEFVPGLDPEPVLPFRVPVTGDVSDAIRTHRHALARLVERGPVRISVEKGYGALLVEDAS